MTQEEKQLLLVDLSARMSYGVICNTPKGDGYLCSINQTIFGTEYGINIKATTRDYFNDREVYIKPYLRPMSSMTEDEQKEFVEFHCVKLCPIIIGDCLTLENEGNMFDWLNAHHFDYRGLIEKGLAIAVTKENNPYKE